LLDVVALTARRVGRFRQLQAYYAWEWGDALFVVLDPYWNQPVAPELSGDWSLTLGREEYDWLKRTLENSTSTYKFVFAHNLVGGLNLDGAMRGGVEVAKYLEWGGYNLMAVGASIGRGRAGPCRSINCWWPTT
jgi:hypothetical protein